MRCYVAAMASVLSTIVLPIAVGAVALVLLLGLINMMRGGSPNVSQKLMRLRVLLQSYAADYNNKSLTDEKAKKLLDDWIALERDEGNRRSAFAPKVLKAVPAKKAARYLQIENEYRVMLRYEIAANVPLAQ